MAGWVGGDFAGGVRGGEMVAEPMGLVRTVAALRDGETTARALTERALERIAATQASLTAFRRTCADTALEAAVAAGDAAFEAHRARLPLAPKSDAQLAARAAEQRTAEQLLNQRLDQLVAVQRHHETPKETVS